jgi:hypothetical protein
MEIKKAKGPLTLLNLDKSERSPQRDLPPAEALGKPAELEHPPQSDFPPVEVSDKPVEADHLPPQAPAFETLHRRPWMLIDLVRALLIFLSLVVAGGFVLILLPHSTMDQMARGLQSRRSAPRQEWIAFLYLGDEILNNEFHVRGVVRNITTAPIEQMDAAVRFYAHDGTVLETAIVRMNKETIDPDGIAQFDLVYPNYKSQFGSYSVEFKLREGPLVPYKDMRGTRPQSE